jgi:phage antirepressor YoqD-like protein
MERIGEEQKMTVKEVAEALGYETRTVQIKVKELFPDIVEAGKTTMLNEAQVTAIKMDCEKKFAVTTDLEMMMMDARVSEWKTRKIQELQAQIEQKNQQLAIAAPKVESFDAMQRAENTMSITRAAKHFGLHPKTEVFPYLRDCGYLTGSDLPSQAALDAGYLVQRQTRCPDGVFRPAACVMLSQLETWRVRVVPQIEAWKERSK